VEKKPRKRKADVLLLDAHEAERRGLARLIEEEPDLQVCGEVSGIEEAMSAITTREPDAVLVSVELLEGDGSSTVERLRWGHPHLPLIVLSLREAGVHGRRMMQTGVAGYVSKARASREIVPAIRKVLKGGVYSALGKRRKPWRT
jgi:DNA-binding NarL/FixJ family response regulator